MTRVVHVRKAAKPTRPVLNSDTVITLRLPRAVHQAIAEAAAAAGESMNTFIARLVLIEGGVLKRLPEITTDGLRADGWLPADDAELARAGTPDRPTNNTGTADQPSQDPEEVVDGAASA